MTGPHLEDALSAWLDDELAPAARREAALHLEGCPECQAELDLVARARA
ncbi:MAG: anti-sigma factor family protein, partial [Acidimicrobiia bacterium]